MHTSSELIQSGAFTADLTPYMEEAANMYPGGRLQKRVRGFDMVFRRGLVVFTDTYHAMVLADRAQRLALGVSQNVEAPRGPEYFQPDMSTVLPAGGVID